MSTSKMPGLLIGERPRPRALALGLTEAEVAQLYAAFPTVRSITSLSQVAQNEWDVLVTKLGATDAAPHLFVIGARQVGILQSGDFGYADATVSSLDLPVAVTFGDTSRAGVLRVPADLPPILHRVVRDVLAPAAQVQQVHDVLTAKSMLGETSGVPIVRPFLVTSEGKTVAGSFTRTGGMAECWCLPRYVEYLVPWALAARSVWHGLAPDRFPQPAPWMRQQEWRTPTEIELLRARAQLDDERTAALASFDARLVAADQSITRVTEAADKRERGVLTAQGDDLKRVVIAALEDFGFQVQDMDLSWSKGDQLEDLHVRDPDSGDWLALVEIRAHIKGAQVHDLMRLQSRFGPRFRKEHNHPPDRLWYVVNHSLGQDPDQRQPALMSNPSEIALFAEDGGLVIDSVELFKLWKAIQGKTLAPAAARRRLIDATGRFTAASAPASATAITGRTVTSADRGARAPARVQTPHPPAPPRTGPGTGKRNT